MLEVIPESWFSWDFTVMKGSQSVAYIHIPLWGREKGMLTVDCSDYKAYREGLMSGAFILELDGTVLARAEKPSAFGSAFLIEHAGKQYTLEAKSSYGRELLLLDGDREIGTISSKGFFTRRVVVELPEELLLPAKVFIIWLALILWKRKQESDTRGGWGGGGAGASGGGG